MVASRYFSHDVRKMVPELIEGLEDRCGGRVNHDECRDFYRDPASSAKNRCGA